MANCENNNTIGKYDKFIPWYFVIFFVFLVIINGFFIYKAVDTHTGVIDKNYYETGIKYNNILEQEKKQKELGWQAELKLVDNAKLYLTLLDKDKNQITGAEVTADVIRPTKSGYDFKIKFKEVGGVYISSLNFPLKGIWDINIKAHKENDEFKYIKRITIK